MARCDSYYFGECTWGACEYAGWIPEHLGNGGDWAASAAAMGYAVTDIPTVGAAVSYAPSSAYSDYGHCGIVTAVYGDGTFEVHEMNYAGFDEYDDRRSSTFDVAGFVLPPGVSPGAQGGGQGMGAGPPWLNAFGSWYNVADLYNNEIPQLIARRSNALALLESIQGA